MRYDSEGGRIEMSAAELVWFARRRTAVSYTDEAEERAIDDPDAGVRRQIVGVTEPTLLYSDCEWEGVRFRITAEADLIQGNRITLVRRVTGRPEAPGKEAVSQARGEFYCAAHILSESTGGRVGGRIVYVSHDSPTPYQVEEEPKDGAPARFFERLLAAAVVHAAPEIERVTRRLPLIAAAAFPYGEVREGQRELMETVYSTVRRGRRLYACAPTGIGKTIATLYPALRALGEGHTDKIFYLTPKNTAATAAADALRRLHAAGVPVRGVMLTAKQTICPRGLACHRRERCGLSPIAAEREDKAARALLAKATAVMTPQDISEVALEWRVCPYELSLRYSQYCDVVICDYNYLFDPRVALKRYFLRQGRYTFLVDEAHNLVERARHIWTKTLSLGDIDTLVGAAEELPRLRAAAVTFRRRLEEIVTAATESELRVDASGVKRGFCAAREMPGEYYAALCELVYACEDALSAPMSDECAGRLRPLCYALRDTLDRVADYDECFTTFYIREGEDMRVKTLCLDPAGVVNGRLLLGGSAILFSATLTPIEYYWEVLGGRRGDRSLEVPSPFAEENLCVAVMDRVSTRFLEREDTVRAVVRAILTAVKAKPGNYMVFCPSYHYMMLLHKALHTAMPALPTLLQKKEMTGEERAAFLAAFDEHPRSALVGFCVMGGIYSEGVDLVGRRLIGAVIVGVGLPGLSDELEAVRAYFDEKRDEGRAYAYVWPGMNRVLQAAGRVIRTETDRGVVLLIDDRFAAPEYRRLIPAHWHGLHFVGDQSALAHLLSQFWQGGKDRK